MQLVLLLHFLLNHYTRTRISSQLSTFGGLHCKDFFYFLLFLSSYMYVHTGNDIIKSELLYLLYYQSTMQFLILAKKTKTKHNGKSISLLAVNAIKNEFASVFVLVFAVKIAFIAMQSFFCMQAKKNNTPCSILILCTGFGSLVPTLLSSWGQFGLDPRIGSCTILPDRWGNFF